MSPTLRYTQNFLHDPRLVADLIARVGITAGDTVLEVGPGKGIITRALAETVTAQGRILAVELDPHLVESLRAEFAQTPQVAIRHQDILALDRATLGADYRVFSNVPFNITSELLETLFTGDHTPRDAFLILQTDALRDSSRDTPTETFKSLLHKPLYEIEPIYTFSRADFRPQPGVETALFAFQRRAEPLISSGQMALYKDFLAFVSKDRVGEGVWKRVLSAKVLASLTESGLIIGHGLKSQTMGAVIAAFAQFAADERKHALVQGAMASLREEQRRREAINAAGGHHRSKMKPRR